MVLVAANGASPTKTGEMAERRDAGRHSRHGEVKEETVQYFVQFDVRQPTDMSREQLYAIWLEEARAALGAVDSGMVTNLWKVVGQRSVFAVLDVPDHTSLDQALESLPIIAKLGGSVDTRAYPIRPYSEWAEELRVAVDGR
jgi:muconolactone D-isomerase